MKRILLSLALLLSAGVLRAVVPDPAPLDVNSASVVQFKGYPSLDPVHAGAVFTMALEMNIKDGWHLNAREGLPEGFIPVEWRLESGAPASFEGSVKYPAGHKRTLAGMKESFPVYERRVFLKADVRLSRTAAPGAVKLPFRVKVQACNDQLCLAPAEIMLSIPVTVAPKSVPTKPAYPEIFQGGLAAQGGGPSEENIIARFLKQRGLLVTFLVIFLAGLALNLTPCVYPMIPLTVSYFGAQRAEKASVAFTRAVAYVLGISVTYTTMGVLAALTGRMMGSALQSPVTLFVISGLLVALSFTMFGFYELQMPSWLVNRLGGAGAKAGGLVGAFMMGLVFGVVAAPCVDPFSIGLLTYVAAKADVVLGFAMFFTLSMGLGTPYLVLGFLSGGISRLPKSGVWMLWVKKVFGFILLGMPLYFLNTLMPEGMPRVLTAFYLLFAGVMLGWVLAEKGVHPVFRKVQWSVGLLLIVLSAVTFQMWPRAVKLPFLPYEPVMVRKAAEAGRPVLLDFSADWCLPCKELELKTFPDSRVRRALEGWVLLKADLTKFGSPEVERVMSIYRVVGVPTLVFLDEDGREVAAARVNGFVSAEELLEKLKQVANERTKP